jgi:hypothetical protein
MAKVIHGAAPVPLGKPHASFAKSVGLLNRRTIELRRRTLPIHLDVIPNKNANADKKPSTVRTP